MKTSPSNSRPRSFFLRHGAGFCSALLSVLGAAHLNAAVYYWDPQGTTGANPVTTSLSGTWENSSWSSSSSGSATPGPWVESDAACFAVHTGVGTPAFTVNVTANHTVAGFFDGPLTPNPCTVTLTGPGILTLAPNNLNGFAVSSSSSTGSLTIAVTLAGTSTAGVCPEDNSGQTYLNGTNTYSGGTYLGYNGEAYSSSIINFNNTASFGTSNLYFLNCTGGALVAEGTAAISITNQWVLYQETPASCNIVGTPGGVTFSGAWALSGGSPGLGASPYATNAVILPSYGPLNLGSGGAANDLITISGIVSGTNAFNKYGVGILAFSATNTLSGSMSVSNGALLLTATGSLSNVPSLLIQSNSTFDVSAINAFSLSSSTSLTAVGTTNLTQTAPATINGAALGTVNLGSQSLTLVLTPATGGFVGETTNICLNVLQAGLILGNNLIVVSNATATPLGAGTYSLIQATNGITGAPTVVVVDGGGLAAGMSASLSVGATNLSLVVAAAASATTTTLSTPSAISYGQSTTFTATVNPIPDGGDVQFFVNGAPFGPPVAVNTTTGTATSMATAGTLTPATYTVTATYGGSPDDAFGASSATAVSQVINKQALTISANNPATTTYGTLFAATGNTQFTSSGLQNGETIGSVSMAVTATPAYSTNTPAGSGYVITPSAATGGTFNAANYTITYNPGTLTINPKALTITASAASKVYGSTVSGPLTGQTTFTQSGLVNGQAVASITVTLTYTGITSSSPVAGSPYAGVIVPSSAVEASGKTNFNPANYTITYADGTLTVTPLAVRLTGSQPWDGLPWIRANSLVVSNAVNGDPVNVVLGLGLLASSNLGVQTISSPATLALGNTGAQGSGTGTGPAAQFNSPSGIGVDTSGDVYVADTANNRVVEVTQGGVETVVPFTGLVDPASVAVDVNSNIYVADPILNEIVEMTAGGTQTNVPFTGLNYPAGVAVDTSGDVFVADTLNSRVVELATNGTLTTLPFTGTTGLYLPSGLAVDTNGDVYVANAGSNNLVELSATGVQSILPFTGLNFATGIAVDTSSNLYIVNYAGANVKELSSAGVVSTLAFNTLTNPAGLAVDSLGDIVVADSGHNRLVETNLTSGYTALAGTLRIPNYTITGAGGSATNDSSYAFSGLSSVTNVYGSSVTLSGTLSASGTNLAPSGVTVTATINGIPASTTTSAGAFSLNYPAGTLPVSGSPYTVTYTSGSTATNIAATDSSTTLTVTPLPVILTGTNTYNGSASAPASILIVSNAVNGDNVTVASGVASLVSADAGVEPINFAFLSTLTLGGSSSPNYTLSGASGAVDIIPAPLTITASNDSKIYGQSYTSNPTAFSSSGLVNGETIGMVTITTPGGGSNPNDPVGSYALQPSDATDGTFDPDNYAITYVPGTLTVNPLTVTLAGTKPYDGTAAAPAGTLVVANTVGSDSVNLASGSGVLASPNAGPEAITSVGTLALGGASATNYTLAGATGTETVVAGTLTITATPETKTYGQALTLGAGSTNFTTSGLQNGDTVGSVTLTASGGGDTAGAQVSGSPYTLTPSAATGGTFNPANYSIIYAAGGLTVSPASLTVTATNTSRIFGSTNPVFTVTYTNFVNGETLATSDVAGAPVVYSLATNFSPVGTYDITNTIGTLTSTNYTFVLVDGTLTITNAFSTNSLTSSENPALPGDSVTFSDTLGTLAPSMAVPRGTVQFQVDGAPAGTPVTLTNGVATFTTSTLTHGSHIIEADYVGDTNVVGSTNTLSELVNTAPVAGTATYARQADLQLTIPIASLLTNATDADGDTLSLIAVSATSTNGASITTNATTVTYTQAATNANVTDSFTYTVADSYGGTSTGTVIVTIASNSIPSSGSATVLPNKSVEITFVGTPGYTYYIQATTNLLSPIMWTTVSTNVADSSGDINYIDTTATNNVARYFRTVTP